MLKSIIENKIIDVPWPVYIDSKLYEGSKFKGNSKCDYECKGDTNNDGVNICEHGLSHISKCISGQLVVVTGVFISDGLLSKRYKRNTNLMQRKVSLDAINLWFKNLEEKYQSIDKLVTKTAKSNFEQFHEFVKWAREIGHYSERLLAKSAKEECDAFGKASEELKSLYKTSVMLLDSLDTTALYFNPESAKFGRKKMTDIYSMVHKIKLVLSHSTANKNRANVVIKGRVENKHKVYESFKIVPLSLIQNAIKYKRTGDVDIIFEEKEGNLMMSVVSIGHEIPENELCKLFMRGYRTAKARQMSIEGSGLGLYVLKIVTDAHDFTVKVKSTPIQPLNKKLAKNIFTISIH